MPHHDSGQESCLNFYLQASNYITSFWTPNKDAKKRKSVRYDSINDKYLNEELGYYINDLTLIDSFIAESGDVYFLNIKEIHSVKTNNLIQSSLNDTRILIQMQWDCSMIQMMEQLGFLD